jgi:hypothetical protein
MEIVTEINEKFTKNSVSPKRTYQKRFIRPNVLGIKNPKTFGRKNFYRNFLIFLKKIGKNSYKNAGIVLGYPSILENKIFTCKNFVYNCLLVFTRIYEKISKN